MNKYINETITNLDAIKSNLHDDLSRLSLIKGNKKRFKKVGGFTAIELMFGLGVIALGTIALVWASRGNTNSNNANTMVSDVSTLVQNIQAGFNSSSNGYAGLDNTSAISMNLLPGDLIVPTGTTTIKSKFPNGTIEIAAGAANDDFTITYTNVPAAVCNKAVTTLGGATFTNITINGTAVYDTASQQQMDSTQVGTACSANQDAETIIFTAS